LFILIPLNSAIHVTYNIALYKQRYHLQINIKTSLRKMCFFLLYFLNHKYSNKLDNFFSFSSILKEQLLLIWSYICLLQWPSQYFNIISSYNIRFSTWKYALGQSYNPSLTTVLVQRSNFVKFHKFFQTLIYYYIHVYLTLFKVYTNHGKRTKLTKNLNYEKHCNFH